MTLGNWNGLGRSEWSSGWGDFVVQLVEVSSGWDGHGCVLLRVGRLVKWLECWNQVVRMIYQILDKMEIVS